jgi:hypothetical protein
MNKEELNLIKQYVISTLDEPNGISKEAYDVLILLMQVNRDFAQEMHDVVDKIDSHNNRYFLLEENELDEDSGYEL